MKIWGITLKSNASYEIVTEDIDIDELLIKIVEKDWITLTFVEEIIWQTVGGKFSFTSKHINQRTDEIMAVEELHCDYEIEWTIAD